MRDAEVTSTQLMRFAFPHFTRRQWLLGGLVFLVLAGLVALLVYGDLDWDAVPRAMARLNTATMLVLTTTLPLLGFPISLVYVLIGARFGPLNGLGIVAVITVLHLLGTHLIGRVFFRKSLERFLEKRRHPIPRVPDGENVAVALMLLLTPAIPYFVRNYVLALSSIPFRIYFWIALPVHVLRSYVALFIGDFGTAPSHRGFVLVVIFYAIQLSILAMVACWLRIRHKHKTPKETTGTEASRTA